MDSPSFSRRETLLGAGTALAVAGGGGVLGTLSGRTRFGADRSDGDGTLTACSFNILHERPDSDYPWESRRPRVAEAIDRIGPELLGVQEALPGQLADLRESFPDYEWYGLGREGDDESEAVPVAWPRDRFEARETGDFWLSSTPETRSVGWDAHDPRIATWASLTDTETGTDVWFCNTHVSWATLNTRRESADLLRRRALQRSENGEQVVLTLDLNAGPESSPYRTLAGRSDAGPSPVVDGRKAADAASVTGPEATYHDFTDETEERLDYVFTPREADVRGYETLDVREGEYRSDHLPVAARFEP